MSSPDLLRARLEGMVGGPLPEYHVLHNALQTVTLEPQQLFSEVGIIDRRLVFVIDGVLSIAIPHDGREWIRRFAGPGDVLSCVPPLGHPIAAIGGTLLEIPAQASSDHLRTQYRVRAITKTRLRTLDAAIFWSLVSRHPKWQFLALLSFLVSTAQHEKRERELLTLSAEERYRALVAERPELLGRVPQKDLARYIGVTPVAMSRIVTRIRAGARSDQPGDGGPIRDADLESETRARADGA